MRPMPAQAMARDQDTLVRLGLMLHAKVTPQPQWATPLHIPRMAQAISPRLPRCHRFQQRLAPVEAHVGMLQHQRMLPHLRSVPF